MRFFASISYNGSGLSGWQIQDNAPSVQDEIQKAASAVLGEKISVVGAGRTDAGVHASDFTAHFDSDSLCLLEDPAHVIYKINAILPKNIVFRSITRVRDDAHARFDADSRTYRYYIHGKKDPFVQDFSWYCKYPLDVEAMNRSAALLLGQHDFSCFEKTGSAASSPLCEVTAAGWSRWTPAIAPMPDIEPLPSATVASGIDPSGTTLSGTTPSGLTPSDFTPSGFTPISGTIPGAAPDAFPSYLVFTITANRFLRNMVRAIVGTLVEVGRGRHEPEWVLDVMASRDRCRAGQSVPGHALFLTRVHYPDDVYRL
jgi:tRNA pseudouridine38-40 synthase